MKKIIIPIIMLLVLDLHFVYCQESPIDSTLISVEHATINGEFYRLTYRTNDTLAIFDSKKNIVFNKKYDYASIAFVDFNQDGHKDVVLDHSTGNGNLSLILFDSTLKIFRPVENLYEYTQPEKIKNTNYYFSYSKAGCADYVWCSNLFKIENYKLINLALIYGDGCPPKKRIVKTRIDIYKIYYDIDKKELSEKLPYKKYIRNANKRKFIKQYWFKNFKYFD